MPAENYTEKVSVNINVSSLSSIDLLVDHGYYSNRSDFINQAVRAEIQRQQGMVEHIIRRNERPEKQGHWFLGVYGITAKDVEEMHQKAERADLRGYGLLIIDENCDEEKLYQVFRSVSVRGQVRASRQIKAHYGMK